MRTCIRFYPVILSGILACVLTGCSGSDVPELGHVTGKVTLEGKPLPHVEVVFRPEKGRASQATTNEQGEYELKYARDIKGALIGSHRVYISPLDEEFSGSEEESTKPRQKQKKITIPVKYNANTSLHEIVKEGENHFDFDLDSK